MNKDATFYDFKKDWNTLFVPILNSKPCLLAKYYIYNDIYQFIIDDNNNTYGWDSSFRDTIKYSEITKEEKLTLISKHCMGKFSPCISEEEQQVELFNYVSNDDFDDENCLEYYFLVHQCQLLSLLIWTWCKTVWPEKKWLIADDGVHTFVVCDKENLIYDILYQYIPFNFGSTINFDHIKYYSTPYEYYPLTMMNTPFNCLLSEYEIRTKFKEYMVFTEKEEEDLILFKQCFSYYPFNLTEGFEELCESTLNSRIEIKMMIKEMNSFK